MQYFYSIKEKHQDEIEIEKSRFITYLFPVENEIEAITYIDEIKKKHYDATHNISAFYIRKNSFYKKYSDDGEPSGTAGLPSLQTILNKELVDICLVTTRYFGGIKLGSGGLIRAYIESASKALESATIIKFEKMKKYDIEVSYDLFGNIKYFIEQNNILLENIEYSEYIYISIYLKEDESDYINKMINMTASKIKIIEKSEKYVAIENGKPISFKEII